MKISLVEVPEDVCENIHLLSNKGYCGHATLSKIIHDAIDFAYNSKLFYEKKAIKSSLAKKESRKLELIEKMLKQENASSIKEGKFLVQMPKDDYMKLKGITLKWCIHAEGDIPEDDSTVICEAIRMSADAECSNYPDYDGLESHAVGYPDYCERESHAIRHHGKSV